LFAFHKRRTEIHASSQKFAELQGTDRCVDRKTARPTDIRLVALGRVLDAVELKPTIPKHSIALGDSCAITRQPVDQPLLFLRYDLFISRSSSVISLALYLNV
jgi:hypothetical protein